MNSFRLLIGALWCACAASAALGQTGAPAPTQSVPRAAAQPGAAPVPRATFIATMDAEFRRMDTDKNGILTRKEIEEFQRTVAVLAAQRRNAALFQQLDKDKNGSLTAGEFAGLPMNIPRANAAGVLGQTDGNRDGQVTIVEYRAGKLVNFDRMDSDKDGIVSPTEMRAAGLIR
jgi:Ca2+-binding EF-hand superfamily protein